jgi:hypothetical protein
VQTLDLKFRKGDLVSRRWTSGYRPAQPQGTVVSVRGERVTFKPYRHPVETGDAKDLVFVCHNHGAPFENTVLDEEGKYQDGFESGLKFGRQGRFYQAGGPFTCPEIGARAKCRHQQQECDFLRRNNKAFRDGWAAGQLEAQAEKHRRLRPAKKGYLSIPEIEEIINAELVS